MTSETELAITAPDESINREFRFALDSMNIDDIPREVEIIRIVFARVEHNIEQSIRSEEFASKTYILLSWKSFAISAVTFFRDMERIIDGVDGKDIKSKLDRIEEVRRRISASSFDFFFYPQMNRVIRTSNIENSFDFLFGYLYAVTTYFYESGSRIQQDFSSQGFVTGLLDFAFKVRSRVAQEINDRIADVRNDMIKIKEERVELQGHILEIIDERLKLNEERKLLLEKINYLNEMISSAPEIVRSAGQEALAKLDARYSFNELESSKVYFARKARSHFAAFVVVCLASVFIIVTSLFFILSFDDSISNYISNYSRSFPREIQAPATVLLISGVLGMLFWLIRVLTRIFMQERELRNDALERVAMIESFVALLDEGKIAIEMREVILREIFRSHESKKQNEDISVDFSGLVQFFRNLPSKPPGTP